MHDISPHERIKVLDGLRAIAILLVMIRHSLKPFWQDYQTPFLPLGNFDLAAFLMNGWSGVDLFFVLSGFLITRQIIFWSIQNRESRLQTLKKYGMRRFFRIVPAYYLILTLTCLGLFASYPALNPETVWGWRFIYHLLFLQDYFPPDILPVFWSLAVEFKFYILAPFMIWALFAIPLPAGRYGVLALCLLASVAAKYNAAQSPFGDFDDHHTYFLTMRTTFHLTLDGLLMGMTAAILWHDESLRRFLQKPFIANLLFFSGLALFLSLTCGPLLFDDHVSFFDKVFLVPLISLSFSLIMLGLLAGCRFHRFFESRSLKGIALISYSLYLIHLPVMYTALQIATTIVPGAQDLLLWLAFLPPYFLISACYATLLYFYIEKPFIDWAKKKTKPTQI